MKCKKCGMLLKRSDRFCPRCGQANAAPDPQKQLWYWVAGIAAAAAAVILLICWISGAFSAPKKAAGAVAAETYELAPQATVVVCGADGAPYSNYSVSVRSAAGKDMDGAAATDGAETSLALQKGTYQVTLRDGGAGGNTYVFNAAVSGSGKGQIVVMTNFKATPQTSASNTVRIGGSLTSGESSQFSPSSAVKVKPSDESAAEQQTTEQQTTAGSSVSADTVRDAYLRFMSEKGYLADATSDAEPMVGYCTFDLDQDGLPELLLCSDGSDDFCDYMLYTTRQGQITPAGSLSGFHYIYCSAAYSAVVYSEFRPNANMTVFDYQVLQDGRLINSFAVGWAITDYANPPAEKPYAIFRNGQQQPITEEEYANFREGMTPLAFTAIPGESLGTGIQQETSPETTAAPQTAAPETTAVPQAANPAPANQLSSPYADVIAGFLAQDPAARGALIDLDGNGVNELVVMNLHQTRGMDCFCSVYGCDESGCVPMLEDEYLFTMAGGPNYFTAAIQKDGRTYFGIFSETGETGGPECQRYGFWKLYSVHGTQMTKEYDVDYIVQYGEDDNFVEGKSSAHINGTPVSYSEYLAWTATLTVAAEMRYDFQSAADISQPLGSLA